MNLYSSGEYRASAQWPYAICAGCVVYRIVQKKLDILLLRRKAGDFPHLPHSDIDSYHLPKGHVELGTTLEETALRETKEEAGCIVELQTYLGAKLDKFTLNNISQEKTTHYFAGMWKQDAGTIDHEHSDTVWVSGEDAVKMLGKLPKQENEMVQRLMSYLKIENAV